MPIKISKGLTVLFSEQLHRAVEQHDQLRHPKHCEESQHIHLRQERYTTSIIINVVKYGWVERVMRTNRW